MPDDPDEPGLCAEVRALRLFRRSPRVPLEIQRRIAHVMSTGGVDADGREVGPELVCTWLWRPSIRDKMIVEDAWADLTGGTVDHQIQGVRDFG